MTNLELARRWQATYCDGDVGGVRACLGDGWVMHEAGGATSTADDLAEITRIHAASFPEKHLEYIHEVESGDIVAQYVRYTFVHSASYFDLQPTGRRVEFDEMVFHRVAGGRIRESWRLTYPLSMYQALREGSTDADESTYADE